MKHKVAIVPSTLEQKLFGTSIEYTENYIAVNINDDTAEFFGPNASKYSYKPDLRARISELRESALRSSNKYFVLEGTVCRAAQSTISGALRYMTEKTVLVAF